MMKAKEYARTILLGGVLLVTISVQCLLWTVKSGPITESPWARDVTFSGNQVQQIYETFVKKDPAYHSKHQAYTDLIDSRFKGHYDPKGRDAPRVYILIDFIDWIQKHNISSKNALFTDINDPEINFLPHIRTTAIPYQFSSGQNDLHQLALIDRTYDFVLFSQTLEHLYNPLLSLRNLYDHMDIGGYMFTSVPTLNVLHMYPHHFQHFTPSGLAMLCRSAGFEIVELGYWGNLEYAQKLLSTYSWPDMYEVPRDSDGLHPAQTWILARKPGVSE
ncbi:S-adenosyl-L-methionine-dependent methyltransferase [Fimicolochytrium jonesii]|uniref:S-adenosyl-L-methionine-dependent methyltransferase n=1 Tax=Fimicolochytrium jonesii TaxID=1396493 RepID=UPI0022FE2908|nr:S-adenosyl-L-methionine-dependent methyltransferase [Fimicolochytrium jonesii]KAI8816558.1 S-adenosyl-L-methionine-dependent methyltransferase [Fimicolochytrium jonesii]